MRDTDTDTDTDPAIGTGIGTDPGRDPGTGRGTGTGTGTGTSTGIGTGRAPGTGTGAVGDTGDGGGAEERGVADWLRVNRANWDDRVRVHAASRFYDIAGFRAGASTLRPVELEEVGDVSGKSLLHLQCHMGQDTLSWARLGARVTGLDFSGAAVRQATVLAADLGMGEDRARFVVSDVYDAVQALGGERFDVVCTGLGALVWLPDVDRWARVVASLLREGGFLYLAEFHPLADVLADDGKAVGHDYFEAEGERCDVAATYTDGPALTKTVSVQWQHTMGAVVTALASAGLRIEFLHEFDSTLFARFPVLQRVDGAYRFPPGHPRVPLMYSLRAAAPGA